MGIAKIPAIGMLTETKYLQRLAAISLVILLFTFGKVHAQLCTGSLGDPIVNIDFGSGTGRGAALGSAVTAYTYAATGELNEGAYTIANTTSGLKGNAWHVTPDHTGNSNGYMMVINSATLASEGVFYTKTVSGLCINTTYEFSAWVMNIMNPSAGTDQYHPNVTFRISTTGGTVLGSYSSGEIPQTSSPQWNQYGFYFTTGAETAVVITILNSAASATPGNDVALDDIKFRPCGPSVVSTIAGGNMSMALCEGDVSVLTFTSTISGGYATPSYQWQLSTDNGTTWMDITGATTTSYTRQPTAAGTWLYRLAVANGSSIASLNCRIASNVITVTVHENPSVTASSNNPICYNDSLKLFASSGPGGSTYAWNGPNAFTSTNQNPVINQVSASNNGWYYLTITTAAGCTGSDSVQISTNGSPAISAGTDVHICQGTSTTLNGTGSGNSFSWSPGSTLSDSTIQSPLATPADTTSYILKVNNGQCISYDTVVVFVWKKPTANAGPDKYMIEGTSVPLSGSAGGDDVFYDWSPVYNLSVASILNPVVAPAKDTTYTLYVISTHGCGTAKDEVKVWVYKNISIPNAFSPNNDGINDTWSIKQISSYTDADILVFNRYGQLVFKTKGYTTEWDGKRNGQPLPVGTYYYIIDLKTVLPLRFSGWVVLLR